MVCSPCVAGAVGGALALSATTKKIIMAISILLLLYWIYYTFIKTCDTCLE